MSQRSLGNKTIIIIMHGEGWNQNNICMYQSYEAGGILWEVVKLNAFLPVRIHRLVHCILIFYFVQGGRFLMSKQRTSCWQTSGAMQWAEWTLICL